MAPDQFELSIPECISVPNFMISSHLQQLRQNLAVNLPTRILEESIFYNAFTPKRTLSWKWCRHCWGIKGLAELQRHVSSNIYLFLAQWSKTSLSESLFLAAGWCWMMFNAKRSICLSRKNQKSLCYFFSKMFHKTLRYLLARPLHCLPGMSFSSLSLLAESKTFLLVGKQMLLVLCLLASFAMQIWLLAKLASKSDQASNTDVGQTILASFARPLHYF